MQKVANQARSNLSDEEDKVSCVSTFKNDSSDDDLQSDHLHRVAETSSDKSDQTFESSTVLSSELSSKLTNAHPDHQFYTDHVMMCEPTAFYLNEETIEDNKFMQRVTHTKE